MIKPHEMVSQVDLVLLLGLFSKLRTKGLFSTGNKGLEVCNSYPKQLYVVLVPLMLLPFQMRLSSQGFSRESSVIERMPALSKRYLSCGTFFTTNKIEDPGPFHEYITLADSLYEKIKIRSSNLIESFVRTV